MISPIAKKTTFSSARVIGDILRLLTHENCEAEKKKLLAFFFFFGSRVELLRFFFGLTACRFGLPSFSLIFEEYHN